jgi:hypothetical protein
MQTLGRKTTAAAGGVLLAGGLLAGATALPAPVGAATTVQHIAGNFVGDAREEIFEYRPGTGADFMFVDFRINSSNRPDFQQISYVIPGSPAVFAGDFDGDGHDELFLYGGGTAPDYIWDFVDSTNYVQHPVTIGGLYYGVPGDYDGDGDKDILWYAPGQVADEIWEFLPGTGFPHTTHPIDITGDYVALPGRFTGDGADDVIFYGRGDIADHLFDFRPQGGFVPVKSPFGPITGEKHQPFTLDSRGDGWSDIFFYDPGTAGDPYWDFTPGGILKSTETVNGTYTPAAGDLFGDGCDDVFWFGTSSSSIWNWHRDSSGTLVKSVYAFGT